MSPSGISRRRLAAIAAAAPLGALLVPEIAAAPAAAEEVTPAAATPDAALTATPTATPTDVPKRELRALWIASVVNIDWPKAPRLDEETLKADYRAWLDLAERLHHNAVVVQVRPTADAFWPSPYEPWSEWLTGARDGAGPGWDPLAFLVEEAHARNLEFHAWFNPYRVSMPTGAAGDITKLAPNHPVREHPDWAVAYPVGNAATRLYYNPGIPAVREFVQTAIMDAVLNYDIDGVHFDDYFYPYPASGQDFGDDATFAAYGAGWASKAEWRRNNIDLLVSEMSEKIRTAKPWVKFGVSPFGIWRNKAADPLGSDTNGTQSYDANFADTRKWVKEGWLDYIVPQVYWNIGFAVADYAKLVSWWSDVVAGTDVQLYIGQADYKISAAGQPAAWFDPAEMSRHIAYNRGFNVAGNIHFSAKDVLANRLGATDRYAAERYSRPALVPALARYAGKPMLPPVITQLRRESAGVRLKWQTPADGNGPFADTVAYAIYRFDGFTPLPDPSMMDTAANLLATVRGEEFVDATAVAGQAYTYVVRGLDRVWHESEALPGRVIWR